MIKSLLNEIYHLNIEIQVKDKKISLKYKEGSITNELKEKIKINKKHLIKRLEENELASNKGFTVYNHGDLYEYRYGAGAFLFIERALDNTSNAWRANYARGENIPYKITNVATKVQFDEAFQKSVGFIDWLNKKNNRRMRGA